MVEQNGKYYFKKGELVQLSEHFNSSEFCCKCSNPSCNQQIVSKSLIELLERIRKRFGGPLRIVSGYRCRLHNASVGGVMNSQHLNGEGADLAPAHQGGSMKDLQNACDKESKAMGVASIFIHVDTRKDKIRRWTY